MRIISWNVNGIRAVQKKGFTDWLQKEKPDVLCLQETKAGEDQLDMELRCIPDYRSYWCSGIKKGYSGTANFARIEPRDVAFGFGLDPEFDREGRIIVMDYPEFMLLNVYFPNGQRDDERLKYKLGFYDATLEFCEARRREGRELLVCGDYNTAHNEIDLARPKENEDVSGFLRIERDWMDKWEKHGYVDTFRKLHPDRAEAYTWWSMRTAARGRNVGWRLDYHYVTPGLFRKVKFSEMMPDVMGSDHCPVVIELEL